MKTIKKTLHPVFLVKEEGASSTVLHGKGHSCVYEAMKEGNAHKEKHSSTGGVELCSFGASEFTRQFTGAVQTQYTEK